MGRKRLRALVGIVLLGSLAYVGYLLSRVERAEPVEVTTAEAVEDLPPDPARETGCAEPVRFDWPGGSFRTLEARRACRQADGSSLLDDVTLHLASRDDGERTVEARQGRLPADGVDEPILLQGDVVVRGPDGFTLRADELELHEQRTLVIVRVPLEFEVRDVTATAGDLEHDWHAGVTVLGGDPVVHLAGERTGGRAITIRGRTVRFEDPPEGGPDEPPGPRRVDVRGSGRIEHPEGVVIGERIRVDLEPVTDDVRRIESSGGAETVTTGPAGAGRPARTRRLRAGRVIHAFGPGSTLRSVDGEGEAVLTGAAVTAPPGAPPAEFLAGEHVSVTLADDGAVLSGIRARGTPARLTLVEGAERREGEAGEIEVDFGPDGALTRLSALRDARLAQDSAERRVTATGRRVELSRSAAGVGDRLELEGGPARVLENAVDQAGVPFERLLAAERGWLSTAQGGRLTAGELQGGVELHDVEVVATGDRAEILEDGARVLLTGHASVDTAGRTSHGDEVSYDTQGRVMTVRGRQHTIVSDPGDVEGMGGMLRAEQPVYISADELTVQVDGGLATYAGGRPSMRQGDSELRADLLRLDDREGTLEAEGHVESKLRLSRGGEADAEETTLFEPGRLVEGTSERLRYDKAAQLLRYEGAVTLTQDEAELSGDVVDAFVHPGEGDLERLVATGSALFRSPQGEAEGGNIEYRAHDSLVIVRGGARPARARDADGRFHTGAILEMNLGQSGIRTYSSMASRTRGVSPVAGDLQR